MNELTTESPYELSKDMKFIGEIDHGAFGKVIHVHENQNNLDLAVKVINKSGAGMQLIKKMKEEVSILKKLNHKNVVKFYGFSETNTQLFIKMEYIKYGTLSSWMKEHHKISENDASIIIGKVLSAVEYIHSKQICHRDIKPENIMISKENDLSSIKIIDFGLSAQHFNYLSNNEYCGTFIYMAPEQIEKKLYYYSVDIWSIGILMYMLLNNGKHPFYHKDESKKDFIEKIKMAKLHFINKISYMAKNLMHKLCEPNPSWRYSASLAIKHPWITRNPNDDIPLTFNEILVRNNNKKNAQSLIMISIFLNHIKKNNELYNINKNNCNNNILLKNSNSIIKKNKFKNKLYIINNEYINNCNLISKKEKEKYQKIKERYFEALSTDEEDSFEKAQNTNTTNVENSNKTKTEKNIKKIINKKSNTNLDIKNIILRNIQSSNIKDKIKLSNAYLLSASKDTIKEREKNKKYNKNICFTDRINLNKIKNRKRLYSNKNRNLNIISNIDSTIKTKEKSKSISKFFYNMNNSKERLISKNDIVYEKEKNELIKKLNRPSSLFKSSQLSRDHTKPNLPYIPTIFSRVKNLSYKKENNYIRNYNIIPLVLPFIGIQQDLKKYKIT